MPLAALGASPAPSPMSSLSPRAHPDHRSTNQDETIEASTRIRPSRSHSRLSLTPEHFIYRSPSASSSTRSSPRRRSAAGGGAGLERGDAWPLISALEADRREEAKELILRNVGIHSVNDDLSTCEMLAARKNNIECLELLLERKQASLNSTDLYGWTALMYACYYGHPEASKRLLLAGAQVDIYDNDHMSALHWAAGRGHTQCVALLIQFGHVKVNQADKCGTSALIWACRKGHTELASLLLKAGANVDCTGMFGWSALLVAVQGNHLETLRLLLQYKPNVNTCDVHRCTPLIVAAKEGRVEMVKLLLKARAFVNLTDEYANTALIHAAKGNHCEVIELLLKQHANIDHCGLEKKTALFWAIEKGHQQAVERLLQSRPNLELANKDGETCLIKAVKLRRFHLAQLLLQHHAKTSATDKNGDSVLHVAIRLQSVQMIQLILSNQKNQQLLNKPNKAKQTPIMLAQELFKDENLRREIFTISSREQQQLRHSGRATSEAALQVVSLDSSQPGV